MRLAILIVPLLATTVVEAFLCQQHPNRPLVTTVKGKRRLASSRIWSSSSSETSVESLRAAAAKAREEAERLSQELGKTTTMEEASTSATATAPTVDVSTLVPPLLSEPDASKRIEGWKQLQAASTRFASANLKTFPMTLSMLQQRTGLTAESLGLLDDTSNPNVNLDDFKYATLGVALGSAILGVVALALLPPNIGATVCYLVALVPILFLALGSTVPEVIANAIAGLKNGGNSEDSVDASGKTVTKKERVCRHEAAHLCCGYWCGLAITDYAIDDTTGSPQVEFGASSQQYSATEVAALAVTGLAGSVGEALQYGKAYGASQDLLQVETVYRKAADFYGAAAQQDVTRWAAFTATQLLQQNKDAYEKVVGAIERQASVEECVSILES